MIWLLVNERKADGMTRGEAQIHFELLCRQWRIPRGKAPAEGPPRDVSTDIYALPATRSRYAERRRPIPKGAS